jgi:hypothetical protein
MSGCLILSKVMEMANLLLLLQSTSLAFGFLSVHARPVHQVNMTKTDKTATPMITISILALALVLTRFRDRTQRQSRPWTVT